MTIRAGLTASVALAAAALPPAAGAAVAPGTFRGTTSAADPLGFRVNAQGRVTRFHYEGVRLTCTDGDRLDSPSGARRVITPVATSFRVAPAGTFGIVARNPRTGFGWSATGRFASTGRRATGTLSLTARFNTRNEPDPDGAIRCQSRRLTWTATRRPAR